MQKRNLLCLTLLLTLVSCGDNNPSSSNVSSKESNLTSSLDSSVISNEGNNQELIASLDNAKKGLNLKGSFISYYPSDSSSYDEGEFDITLNDSFYYEKRNYKDSNDRDMSHTYILTRGNDGKIENKQLSISNEEEIVDFLEPLENGQLDYDKYLTNPFKGLTSSDFVMSDERYKLNEDKVSAFDGFVNFEQMREFRNHEVTTESVSFSLTDNGYTDCLIRTKLRSDDNWFQPDDFYYEFTLDFVFKDNLTVPSIDLKEHREEHTVLATALNDLQTKIDGHNYTVHAVDAESTNEFDPFEYDIFATEEGFYSTFKPALNNYYEGYQKGNDGNYYLYKHIYSTVPGQEDVFEYQENNSKYKLSRKELDVDVSSFAPEFFVGKDGEYVTTDEYVVAKIREYICPFSDRYDPYLVGTKVWIKLDESNQVKELGCTAYDWGNEYTDNFTYTFSAFGETTLPYSVPERA